MSTRSRLVRRTVKVFLPFVLIVLVVMAATMIWIVYGITRPARAPYLVTPQTFAQVTGPALKATDVTWNNHDGTKARGWVIRGAEGAPAVILLHRYGADRSWLLNLAAKLNVTTNFTVLWPDLRGHGENPLVNTSSLGAIEGDDATAAIDYLHTLKTPLGKPQVAGPIGLYGVELGAYAALDAARRYPEVRAMVLDSTPGSPDDLIRAVTIRHTSMNNSLLPRLGSWGVRIYSLGKYHNTPSCDLARSLKDVKVVLLTGDEADPWRVSTLALGKCFASGSVEVKKDLTLTGLNLPASTGEQEEAYDRPVIDFFDKALR
jgi:pimeloyl-ACP methyl ester carboxylesterase